MPSTYSARDSSSARTVARRAMFVIPTPCETERVDGIVRVGYEAGRSAAGQKRLPARANPAPASAEYRLGLRPTISTRMPVATVSGRRRAARGFDVDPLLAVVDERIDVESGAFDDVKRFGKDYFDELLERIREIRASERRFYLKITDIYEQCSIDYDTNAEITKTFFKTVQNKLHWAVTGQTAAEIIAERADATKPTMGLTTWKNAPTARSSRATCRLPRTT